jgi:hypothetical protein
MKSLEKLQEHKIKGSLRNYVGGDDGDTNSTSTITATDNVTCKTTKTTSTVTDNPDGSSCTRYLSMDDQV